MKRNEIIDTIGKEYFISNIEEDGFSYKQVLHRPIEGYYKLDLRFEKDNYSILVETKRNKKEFNKNDINQIQEYAKLEREYKKFNSIISILYDIKNETIKVWKDEVLLEDEKTINSMDYYINLYSNKKNDKNNVIDTTNSLNDDLHAYGISEQRRSQFVGSLLVALNNGLIFDNNLETYELIERIKRILKSKIENDNNKQLKTDLLIKILEHQEIKEISSKKFCNLLDKIKRNLIPYIDSNTSEGDDLLNLFFTTFNKYVGKADKNQAFIPTHITDFMCEIANISENSRVLDPTCGSGSFLVQAMSKMLGKAGNNEKLRENIKKNQIFGIEKEEKAFGLATTNMLIHEDGKTNVILGSCFEKEEWIKKNNINIVLMNPPFNGQKMPNDCPKIKKKDMDATKGFYFVKYIADVVNKGKLVTILPLQCAIGNDSAINEWKHKMLKNHTLKAVFSLPDDIFHPGASVNTCIMLFELDSPHNSNNPTFFGYYKDDGFIKKKNKGRIEKRDWNTTKKEWLYLFNHLEVKPGYSVLKNVDANDEWLAEAHMETDYSILKEDDFVKTIREYIAFKIKTGGKI
ncbi:MAG: SAM-dependent methyltransferase [Ureaplasma sp.]|nr:SAM-dependent methyltransferase [Ureaplasma sp.]